MREGVKVVLAGNITREGEGYAVTLRAVNPADGKQTWGARAVSSDQAGGAVGRQPAGGRPPQVAR